MQILRLKCTEFIFRLDPAGGGSLQRSPDPLRPLAAFKGRTLRGGRKREKGREEGKVKGRREVEGGICTRKNFGVAPL